MLQKDRLYRIQEKMKQTAMPQMLVTDPMAIYWLCGKLFAPGERFLGLLLQTREESPAVLIVNELFRFDEELGIPMVWYSDTDDVTAVLKPLLHPEEKLGVDQTMAAKFLIGLMEGNAAAGYVNGSFTIDETRAVKDAAEQEKLRRASLVNDAAMEKFKGLIHAGVTELEIADQMLGIYKSLGASAHSFDPIVAFGDHAADPHHMPDHTVLKEGDTVLFDVGCIVDDYCSDMTRTVAVGKISDEQKKVYDLVYKAQTTACEAVRAGVPCNKIDAVARDIIYGAGYEGKFGHGLGHSLGLEIHENPRFSPLCETMTEAGMVLSVEPGIYLEGQFGVRIEDIVEIRENDCDIITKSEKKLIVL